MTARAPGEGWALRCPACTAEEPSLPGGRCRVCDEGAVDLPVVLEARDLVPQALRPAVDLGRDFLAALRVAPGQSPWTTLVFLVGLLGGSFPLSPVFLLWLALAWSFDRAHAPPRPRPPREVREPASPDAALPPGASPRPRRTTVHAPGVALRRSWWDITRIGARRGLVLHLDLRLEGRQGARPRLTLRVRGPDGRLLRSPLPRYRGPRGEAWTSHAPPPLQRDDSRFPDLWIFLPLRALGLPGAVARAELTLEAELALDRATVLVHRLPVDFVPLPEDHWDSPALEGDPAGLLLGEVAAPGASSCGVCGEEGPEVERACPACAARHHPECWDYLGGCSRFGCTEAPVTPPG